jgi:lysophospholipase L1-like esterase
MILLLLASSVWAQQAPVAAADSALLGAKEAAQLTTRIEQLMESTAVSVPGLTRASESVRGDVEKTRAEVEQTPRNPVVFWHFITQVKAYLALSDTLPRPYPFSPTADRQFAELRDGLERVQQHFEALLESRNTAQQKREADPNGLTRYSAADKQLLPPGMIPRVVFLGDSITDSWRLNEYFTGRDFVNRGIGGQTTSQMLARFLQDVLALNPKAVVILGGTNDIASGIAVNQIEDNLAMMGDLAKAHGIKAIFASILPVSDYHKDVDPGYEMTKTHTPATIQVLNRWIQVYCINGGFGWLDYYSAMVDSAGQMKADLSDDGLHPNSKGYRVMSPVAIASIDRLLSRQPQQESAEAPKRRFRLPAGGR